VDLLKSLDRHTRHLVAKTMQMQFHADKEDIVRQGTLGDEFFVLVHGRCVTTVDGKQVFCTSDYDNHDHDPSTHGQAGPGT
jgi:CRP-like cAMP-binding protein